VETVLVVQCHGLHCLDVAFRYVALPCRLVVLQTLFPDVLKL
jgi:hypothetical protein